MDLPMLSALKFLSNAACLAGPPSLASVLAVTVLLKPVPFNKASQLRVRGSGDPEICGYRADLEIKSIFF